MKDAHGGPGVAQWLRAAAATAETGRLSGCEVATLFAMLVFANWRTGECWPTVARLARVSRRSERATQRAIGELVSLGLVMVPEARRGGRRGKGTMYRLDFVALARMATGATSAPVTGVNGVPDGCHARESRVPNPTSTGDGVAPNPTREQPENHHHDEQVAVDVFARLGINHLHGHERATPDRMAWIERVAPTKRDPGAWAAECIRGGWAVPPITAAEVQARRKERREATLARFDAMPEPERRAVLARVRATYPNLNGMTDDQTAVRGAIARIIDPETVEG